MRPKHVTILLTLGDRTPPIRVVDRRERSPYDIRGTYNSVGRNTVEGDGSRDWTSPFHSDLKTHYDHRESGHVRLRSHLLHRWGVPIIVDHPEVKSVLHM